MTITKESPDYVIRLGAAELLELQEAIRDRLIEARQHAKSFTTPSPELTRRMGMLQDMKADCAEFLTLARSARL